MNARTRITHLVATVIAIMTLAIALFGAAPATAATVPRTAVWIGAPFAGTWPTLAYSQPSNHPCAQSGGACDWAIDFPKPAGTPVVLYAAPQDGRTNVSARVIAVNPSCNGASGYTVVVGLYAPDGQVGTVAYTHISPRVSAGQVIPRWGTTIGIVGNYRGAPVSCWDGEHLHAQFYNVTRYSCFNRGFIPLGLTRNFVAPNFIGFVGGAYASGPRQPCP